MEALAHPATRSSHSIRSSFLSRAILLACAAALAACSDSDGDARRTYSYDFEADLQGWQALFADYPAGSSAQEQAAIDEFYELRARRASLPQPLTPASGAIELQGSNHSDDLKMLVKRKLAGLAPSADYELDVVATIATNAPRGCFGVGGSPGEGVWLKAGATNREPTRVAAQSGNQSYWRLNIDLGDQSEGGAEGRVLDDFTNSQECDTATFEYERKTVSTIDGAPLEARTDASGSLWVVFGTDSGFEGLTRIYIDSIEIVAQRR